MPSRAAPRRLPRTVRVLGGVSFLADVASDMAAPLVPLFLASSFGAGNAIVGLIEGVAESTASLVKLVSGRMVDRGAPAKGLAVLGYAVAGLSRPLLAVSRGWGDVLLLRFTDRVGKGLRTAPRDTLLAEAVEASDRGRAFGFHRAMDHLGGACGPLVATALLAAGLTHRGVFAWTVVPGALAALLLLFGVRRGGPAPQAPPPPPLAWRSLDARVQALVVAAAVLAAATLPDALFVLWLVDAGLPAVFVPLAFAAASAGRSLVAWPAGALSDRVGRRRLLLVAWPLRAAVLLLIPFTPAFGTGCAVAAWLVHAAGTASTEGAERALVGDAAGERLRGTAYGAYHFAAGITALPGAALLGLAWERAGAFAACSAAAVLTLGAAAALLRAGRT